jgi:WD40 repeat protein
MAFSMTMSPAVFSSMNSSIVHRVQNVTSSTKWRDSAQLRGLQANHPSLPIYSAPLAPPTSTVFSTTQLALHPTENAVAIGLTSMAGEEAGSIGLFSLTHTTSSGEMDPLIDMSRIHDHASTTRWLDLSQSHSSSQHITSVEWGTDMLFAGCSEGIVCIGDYGLAAASEPSSGFACVGTLSAITPTESGQHPPGTLTKSSPSGFAPSSAVRSLQSGAPFGSQERLLAAHEGSTVVWDLNGAPTPLWRGSCVTTAGSSASYSPDDLVLVAKWAPHCGGSATISASGTYKGNINLHDTRLPSSSPSCTVTAYSTSTGGASLSTPSISSVEFHPSLPWLLASGGPDGVLRLYDLRFPRTAPVMPIATCQGGVTSLKWVPTHPDLLISSGRDATTRLWCLRSSPSYCVGTWRHRLPVMSLVTTSTFARVQCLGVGLDGELTSMQLSDEALSSIAPVQFVPPAAGVSPSASVAPSKRRRVLRDESVQRGLALLYCRNMTDACSAFLDVVQRVVSAQDRHTATALLEHLLPCPVHPFRLDTYLEVWRGLMMGAAAAAGGSSGAATNALGLAPTSSAISALLSEASPFLSSPTGPDGSEFPLDSTTSASSGASSSFSVSKLRSLLDADLELFSRRVPELIRVFDSNSEGGDRILRGLARPSAAQRARIDALRLSIEMQRCCEEGNTAGAMQLLKSQSDTIRSTPSAVEYLNAETLCSTVAWLVNPSFRKFSKAATQSSPMQNTPLVLEKRYTDARAAFNNLLDSLILPDGTSPSKPLIRKLVLAALGPIVVDGAVDADGTIVARAPSNDKTISVDVLKKRRKWIDRALRDLDALRDAVEVQLHVLHIAAVREFLTAAIASTGTPAESHAATTALKQQPSIVDIVNQYQESLLEEDDDDEHVSSLGIFSWLSERAIIMYLDELSRSSVSGLAVFLWTSVQFLHHLAGLSSTTASQIDELFFNVLNRFERSQQKLKGQLKAVLAVLDPSATSEDDDSDNNEDTRSPTRRGGGATANNHKKASSPPQTDLMRKRQIQVQLTTLDTLLPQIHAYCVGVLKLQLECEVIAESSGIDRDSSDLPKLMATALELLNQCSSDILEVWADTLDAARELRRTMEDDAHMSVKRILASSAANQRRAAVATASGPPGGGSVVTAGAPSSPEEAMLRLLKHVEAFSEDCNRLLEQSAEGSNDEMLNNVMDICEDFLEEWHA